MLVVIMGVSGSGKTTVGSLLASKLGWKFYDADDYHPEENKNKMARGIPLDDKDRLPWLGILHDILMREESAGENIILACSALNKMYRDILEHGEYTVLTEWGQEIKRQSTAEKPLFVHLHGPIEVLTQRLKERKGHFIPTTLLQSQLDTLEPPSLPEHFITINIEKNILEITTEIERTVHLK